MKFDCKSISLLQLVPWEQSGPVNTVCNLDYFSFAKKIMLDGRSIMENPRGKRKQVNKFSDR